MQKDWKQIKLVDEQCEQILSLIDVMNKSLQSRVLRQVKGMIRKGKTNTTVKG